MSSSTSINPLDKITSTASEKTVASGTDHVTGSSKSVVPQSLIHKYFGVPNPINTIIAASPHLDSNEESFVIREIKKSHLDENIYINVQPLLRNVEEIFNFSHITDPDSQEDTSTYTIPMEISHCIDRISCQIQCKKGSADHTHGQELPIFKIVGKYRWDAKLVLILSSFALSYGEFWLLAQTCLSNRLAKSMASLKSIPILLERSFHPGPNPRYEVIARVVKAMLDITRHIVDFYNLPWLCISEQPSKVAPILEAIPIASYLSVKGIITCVLQMINLSSSQDLTYSSSSLSMGWDPLENIAKRLESIQGYLNKEMDTLQQIIDEMSDNKTFETILSIVYDIPHHDNMSVLSTLISQKDPKPLINCSTSRLESLEYLKHKNVLLLISDLHMLVDEVLVLDKIYRAMAQQHKYEVVWIPLMGPSNQSNEMTMQKFNKLKSSMKWCSLSQPSMINRPVQKFFREIWGFHAKPIMVVLDPRGKVLCKNAFLMMFIWGITAFPFTSNQERELWSKETWKLELLVGEMDSVILQWIKEKKNIFLYGGTNKNLISQFTKEVKKFSTDEGINFEMMYVGNSHGMKEIKNVLSMINKEKLYRCWNEQMIWFFWTRLESMLHSRFQIDKENSQIQVGEAKYFPRTTVELAQADKDSTIQEIMKLVSFGRVGSWAVFAQGSKVLPPTQIISVESVLLSYKKWEMDVQEEGFIGAFWKQLKPHHDELKSYLRVEFHTSYGMLPKGIECPYCHRFMEKHNSYFCCHEDPPANVYGSESLN